MRSPALNASSRPACGASATRLIRLLLTLASAAARRPACDVRPPGPQADRATAPPNYLGSDLKCLRSENGLRFCYRVVVGTCESARCLTRPPDHLGMPLTSLWSESSLVAPSIRFQSIYVLSVTLTLADHLPEVTVALFLPNAVALFVFTP